MSNRTSSFLTIILAGAAAVASGLPRQGAKNPPARAASPAGHADQGAARSTNKPAQPDTSASGLERTGFALVSEYLAAGRPAQSAYQCDRKIAVTHSVIVILPDPLDSHLDWAFDSGLESVRRAMENNHYVLDRYWLPWTLDADTVHRASDHLGNSLRTRAPGVLLFRSSESPRDSIALVYLVGETPTRGIHATAFRAASADRDSVLKCRDTIAAAALRSLVRKPAGVVKKVAAGTKTAAPDTAKFDDTLRVVGPVFSGSARSLRDALEDWHAGYTQREVFIVSGGATAASNKEMLSACDTVPTTASKAPAKVLCAGPRIQFFATVNPVNELKTHIEELLRDRLGVHPGQIAYLNESGTQFGQALRSSAEHQDTSTTSQAAMGPDTLPLQLPFPMNISRLRREYTRRPSANDTLPGAGAAPRTRFDWKDPASASESPSPLSELTAPIMERTLADIEQTLRMHRIRAVGILATDVRDRLFLATIVRERLRDIKIFLIGSHALYLRPELNEQLRGTLVVSTYPIFLESQFWDLTHNEDRQRLVFTSDISEGTYNAMLAQVGARNRMLDYGFPLQRDGAFVPPIWVTVIGATAHLPLVAKRMPVPAPEYRAGGYVLWRDSQATRPIAERYRQPWDAPVITIVLLIGLIVSFGLLIFGAITSLKDIRDSMENRREHAGRPRRVERRNAALGVTSTSVKEWSRHSAELLHHRQLWTIFRFAAVVCAFTPLVLILSRPQVHGDARSQIATGVLGLSLMVTLFGAIIAWWLGRKPEMNEKKDEQPPTPIETPLSSRLQHVLMILLAIIYVVLTGWLIYDVVTLDSARAAMFFMRALHLGSGVTPVVPLIVGGVILVGWSTWHLKRVDLLEDMSAFEAACWDGKIDASRILRAKEDLPRNPLDRARLPGASENFRATVKAIRVGLLRLAPATSAWFLLAGLSILGFWIAVHFQRSMEAAVLGGMLAGLSSAFDYLLRFLILSSLALSAWGLYRLVIVSRSLRNCLLNVEAMPLGAAFDRLPPSVSELTRFTPFGTVSRATVYLIIDRAANTIWLELKAAGYHRVTSISQQLPDLLFPHVRSENGEFDQRIAKPLIDMHEELCREAVNESKRLFTLLAHGAFDASGKASPPRGTFAMVQDLVALYVIDYVEWVVRHLRHLALNLILALALATILISSYPFEPETLVKFVLFTLMAFTVGAVMTTLVQMNRNPTLSRITRTIEGHVTWDRQLIFNLLLVGGVPLITVVGAEFPQVREFLFFWVTPLLRALGKS